MKFSRPLSLPRPGVWFLAVLLTAGGVSSSQAKSPKKQFSLAFPGEKLPIDYTRFGVFENTGTAKFRYVVKDQKGLAQAVGEGIYPNRDVKNDPAYARLKTEKRLEGGHWAHMNSDDVQADFFVWSFAPEDPGVKQFYTADTLERAGLIEQAIKAYYAVVVHYPGHVGWTHWKTPWYVGPTAIDRIQALTKENPKLGLKLEDARIKILNGHNDTEKDDVAIVNPGRIVRVKKEKTEPEPLGKVVRSLKRGDVELVRTENGHWQMLLKGQPFLVRGLAYDVTPVGKSPDNGSWVVHKDWMFSDVNSNGKADGPYDAFVDKNRNDRQEKNEKAVGDFALIQEMGVNTIRLYHHGHSKELLRDLYKTYGIRVIMGDYIGAYAIGSDAPWYEGSDYTNPQHKAKMLESVRQMVLEYKDEPYLLMWMLGNENNYGVVGDAKSPGTGSRAKSQPEAYYTFVNEAAKLIHELDPNHPVSHSNGDLLYLDYFAKYAPEVDIFGCNAYRGIHGFGSSLWEEVKDYCDRPVIITEYGCPAYYQGKSREIAEQAQALYHKNNWLDIEGNSAGHGAGNAVGGVIFHWLDGWWKAGPPPQFDPSSQDTSSQFSGPFPDGQMHEEWLGLASQGDGSLSPFLRQLRPAYFVYKELWKVKK